MARKGLKGWWVYFYIILSDVITILIDFYLSSSILFHLSLCSTPLQPLSRSSSYHLITFSSVLCFILTHSLCGPFFFLSCSLHFSHFLSPFTFISSLSHILSSFLFLPFLLIVIIQPNILGKAVIGFRFTNLQNQCSGYDDSIKLRLQVNDKVNDVKFVSNDQIDITAFDFELTRDDQIFVFLFSSASCYHLSNWKLFFSIFAIFFAK